MKETYIQSVQFSRSVVSDSLWPRGLQYTRLPCPSPTPRACSNSCPLSQWCHPTISSTVIPFFSCLQSFPASGPFPMSQFFTSGSQSIGVSALASVLPINSQDWFPLGLTGLISLLSKGFSRVFSNTTVQKHQFLAFSFLHSPTLTSIHVAFCTNIPILSHSHFLLKYSVPNFSRANNFCYFICLWKKQRHMPLSIIVSLIQCHPSLTS